MKLRTMLLLVALASLASLVLAGNASATTLTSPPGTVYFGTIHGESEGHVNLDTPVGTIACKLTFHGHIEQNGVHLPTTQPASGKLTSIGLTGCTEGWHVTTVSPGSLSVKSNGNGTGDVFSTGATIETTVGGIACRYITNNTTIGTLTGGASATLDISASIPFHNGSIFCGTAATPWTGSVKINTPSSITVD